MLNRLALLSLFAATFGMGATGCFDRPKPECAFLCGADNACPDGYSCAADNWCKRTDVSPTFDCTGGVVDANTTDAPPTPDAPITPDAAPADAATGPDAMPPDAMPPDAMPPDAMPPDAMPPDAMPPDAFVNAAPMLTVPGTKPRTIAVTVLDSFTVTASDPDNGQTVALTAAFPPASLASNPFLVAPPPTFTPATGVFEWTPPAGSEGTYEVQFTATDDYSTPASTSEVLEIIVQ